MGKYTTIQLPTEFVEDIIDKLVKEPSLGYSSRAEVVKEGVRRIYKEVIGFMPIEKDLKK